MGLSFELIVFIEENFLVISIVWSWWKESENNKDEVRERINGV